MKLYISSIVEINNAQDANNKQQDIVVCSKDIDEAKELAIKHFPDMIEQLFPDGEIMILFVIEPVVASCLEQKV